MNFILEICVDNIDSAIIAQESGAHRIELCNNLLEGGTTPGLGTITSVRNNINIEMNVIIRPRGGDFLYSDLEYDIMRRDIEICGENGADGVVLGILRNGGEIDVERTSMLIEFADPMTVTFHRAFDMCNDPHRGLKDIIATGATRLLTSGHRNIASEGAELISNLIRLADGRIIIMPGSGINDTNIENIARISGAKEFHLTARKIIESEMIFRQQGITMGGIPGISEFSRKVSDQEMIRNIISVLNSI